jgi:hypothetical protein
MGSLGAEQKLTSQIDCFRFCPIPLKKYGVAGAGLS